MIEIDDHLERGAKNRVVGGGGGGLGTARGGQRRHRLSSARQHNSLLVLLDTDMGGLEGPPKPPALRDGPG